MLTPESIAASGTEHGQQSALFAWAALHVGTYPELRWMHAIPNGGLRDGITASKLKAEGVKPGVSDICLPVKRGLWSGLYIEMKKPGKGRESELQKEFGEFVKQQGFGYIACWSYLDAKTMVERYLNWPN